MNCGHETYHCTPPVVGQAPDGSGSILVCMWCSTCGACVLRLPQMQEADERLARLRAAPRNVPVGTGR